MSPRQSSKEKQKNAKSHTEIAIQSSTIEECPHCMAIFIWHQTTQKSKREYINTSPRNAQWKNWLLGVTINTQITKNGSLNSRTLSFNKKKDMAKDTYAPASSLVNTLQQLGIIKDILLNIVLDLGIIIDIV